MGPYHRWSVYYQQKPSAILAVQEVPNNEVERYGTVKYKKKAKNKDYFQSLVSEYPKSWIADLFEVSPPLINKLCNEWEIECPPKGYWNKLRKKDFHLDRPTKN